MKIISFMNQKGGSAKTTSCVNIGASLANKGYKILLIDLDPQGHLTLHNGVNLSSKQLSVYEVLKGNADINTAIISLDKLDLLPSDIRLSGVDLEIVNALRREELLKRNIAKIKKAYDFILIDNPPSLSLLTLNAMTASDGIIIPVQAQYFAFHGMAKLLESLQDVINSELNKDLEVIGVILTLCDPRRNLDNTVIKNIDSVLPGKTFKTVINTNISLAEASAFGKDIFSYKPDCKGALQYDELTDEILKTIK